MAVGSVSLAGSVITFAKLQELMTTRPVVFAGYPIAAAAVLIALLGTAVALVVFTPGVLNGLPLGVLLALLGLAAGGAAGAAGRWRRRPRS